jgi:UDPglucose--hexose-1-phosphate uridylyltransferase
MQIRKLVAVWQDRYRDLIARPGVEYVFVFENKGAEIGVTLTHPHGQIYAYPFVPAAIAARLRAEADWFEQHGTTLADAWLRSELETEERVVWQSETWAAIVPFFARYPFEVHIVPKHHASAICELAGVAADGYAEALSVVTRKLDRVFGFSMPYILAQYQHRSRSTTFITEITPPYRTSTKLKYLAGSEACCGVFINDTLPEESASILKGA